MPALSLAASIAVETAAPPRPAVLGVDGLDAADRRLLARLRDLARRAQLTAPMAIDGTCRLAEPGPHGEAEAYGAALLRSLAQVATRPLVFYPRGAEEVGFDEAWLVRLVRCLADSDEDSARLLIGGRVTRIGRRVVTYLAKGFAERIAHPLDAENLEPF